MTKPMLIFIFFRVALAGSYCEDNFEGCLPATNVHMLQKNGQRQFVNVSALENASRLEDNLDKMEDSDYNWDLLDDSTEIGEIAARKSLTAQIHWAAETMANFESLSCYREVRYPPCRQGYTAGYRPWPIPACFEDCPTTHLTHKCTTYWCAESAHICAAKLTNIAVSFMQVMATFLPGAAHLRAFANGAKNKIKKEMIDACKAYVKTNIRKMKNKMIANVKGLMSGQLSDKTKNIIINAAAEQNLAAALQGEMEEMGEHTLASAAAEVWKAIDPTGMSAVMEALEAEACEDKHVKPFPR